jgi:hemolysin III
MDHVGIYLLIAGTYTPVAWSLLRGRWLWGTLMTVWSIALVCATRVWWWGVLPIWVSTLVYLTMGWGSLLCYGELARTYSHRALLPLPLGGLFYSIGAVLNLARWPELSPGVFAAHELFHFLVIAGSLCHIVFMLNVVIPAPSPVPSLAPAKSRSWTASSFRKSNFVRSQLGGRFMLKLLPRSQWLLRVLAAGDSIDPVPADAPAKGI